jgi:hypothetical protein
MAERPQRACGAFDQSSLVRRARKRRDAKPSVGATSCGKPWSHTGDYHSAVPRRRPSKRVWALLAHTHIVVTTLVWRDLS